MMHHIPRFLNRCLEGSKSRKVAHCVLDGLALDQWIVIRDVLSDQRPHWKIHENSVFAWIPTLTSVSRQAIFAGKSPRYFSENIYGTQKESHFWTQFWAGQGLNPTETGYEKGLGEAPSLLLLEETLSHPKLRALGFVVDKVDKIAHGMQLGTAGMHNQVRQWARDEFLVKLIEASLLTGAATSAPVRDLVQSPAFFPFSISTPRIRDLESNIRLQSYRHGLDEDMVMLREQ